MLFLVIWRRNGVVVPVITIGSLLLFNFIFGDNYSTHVAPKVAAFLFAAAAIFAVTKFSEDEGDHFFFIPLRIWAPILAIGGTVISFAVTDSHAQPPASTPAAEVQTQTTAPPPQPAVQAAALTPIEQPPPAPVTKPVSQPAPAPEPEPMRIKQVYVDSSTHLYYPENCPGRPESATRLGKTIALREGYTLAPACSE